MIKTCFYMFTIPAYVLIGTLAFWLGWQWQYVGQGLNPFVAVPGGMVAWFVALWLIYRATTR
jgi:hypothetical protein